MDRRAFLGAVLATAVAGSDLAGAPDPRAVQQDGSSLSDVIERLDLTAAGATQWLEKLGTRIGSAHRTERMLLVNLAGETMLTVVGRDGHVTIGGDLNVLLYRQGAGIVIVHNHPADTGLSAGDLMQLSKRGVSAIAAVGHGGSVYVAAPGPHYGGPLLQREQYRIACAEVHRLLKFYKVSSATPWSTFFKHLVARALDEAGVIEYRAFLSAAIQRAYMPMADVANLAAAEAARLVVSGSQLARPQERWSERACLPTAN